jgi:hypothetical protein
MLKGQGNDVTGHNIGLVFECFDHLGMPSTDASHSSTTDAIDNASTVFKIDVNTISGDSDRRCPRCPMQDRCRSSGHG